MGLKILWDILERVGLTQAQIERLKTDAVAIPDEANPLDVLSGWHGSKKYDFLDAKAEDVILVLNEELQKEGDS
jgi:hypothetical protein